jgi:hypothetical protein
MPSDEGRQVLELLAQGKIDADQAYRLLRALGDISQAPPSGSMPPPPEPPPPPPGRVDPVAPPGRGRTLRIRVTERGKQKVNVAIPLAIARIGKLHLASSGLVRSHLSKFGIDLDQLLKEVESAGQIVDVNDDEGRVEIFVE